MPESQAPAARGAGIVYLLFFVTAAAGIFLARSVVVPGDAAATAAALLAHDDVFRAGFALTLVSNILYIAVTALFYRLFGPADWNVSLVAAFVGVAGCGVQLAGGLFQLTAISLLGDASIAKVFSPAQVQAQALFHFGLFSQSFSVSLVLFAVYDLLLGWLVYRCGFVPRAIGIALMVAGVGWLTFLWPPLARSLSGVVMPFGALAEIALMAWLIVKGSGRPATGT